MKAPFTNAELNAAIAQFGPIDQTIVELQAVINARNAEITKLTSQLEEARAAIREYLDEFDAPVNDYALRTVLRNKLRALLQESDPNWQPTHYALLPAPSWAEQAKELVG